MTIEAKRNPVLSAIPANLFEEARRRLLSNSPLRSASVHGGGLPDGEAQVLESVGLPMRPWNESDGEDPLLHSIADYMALLETSLAAGEVAKYLKVDVSRVRQRIRERTLYAIEYEAEYRLPRFQFERRQVLPGLREVLRQLPETLSALDVAQWFLAPNPDLESAGHTVSPRDWLLKGASVDTVLTLARGFE